MAVTPLELQNFNGRFVKAIDFENNIYDGFLHYNPNDQFPIQLWKNGDCCFITYMLLDDVIEIIPTTPRFSLVPMFNMPMHLINAGFFPKFIKSPCCDALPEVLLMDITAASDNYQCLIGEAYILEWDFSKRIFELNYLSFCGCNTFHVELLCTGIEWILYLTFLDNFGSSCIDGIHLGFPMDCNTLRGVSILNLNKTGICDCGLISEGTIKVSIRPA